MALIWLIMPTMSPDPPCIMLALLGDLSDCACNAVPRDNAANAPTVINNIFQFPGHDELLSFAVSIPFRGAARSDSFEQDLPAILFMHSPNAHIAMHGPTAR